jgi:hypothetical protein
VDDSSENTRTTIRRAEEIKSAAQVDDIWSKLERWSKRWKLIAVVFVALLSLVVSGASWIGQQWGPGPGTRVTAVEHDLGKLRITVDSGFRALDSAAAALRAEQQRDRQNGDLLLRINCRGLEFRDLLAACRALGATR